MDDPVSSSLTNLVGALAVAIGDAQEAAMRRSDDLGASAVAAVVSLGADPGMTVGGLARVLALSHSATVRLVDDLVARDLAVRTVGMDGRSVALRLTAAGHERRRAALAARAAVIDAALDAVTGRERAVLEGLVSRMLCRLTTGRAGADHLCRLCDEAACGGDRCPVEQRARELEAR